MDSKIQNCQNCKNQFVIEPEDFDFYAKISVPPPTWCPECRLRRRMAFMNQRVFYKRACDLCGKESISIFSKDASHAIYCPSCWWSDKWDPMSYGKNYDFSKPFFEQFRELASRVPDATREVMSTTLIDSDYCNISSYLKNCYLLLNSDYDEDCAYGTFVERSKRCFDNYMIDLSELCYRNSNLFKCSKTFFSSQCEECMEVWFSKNLKGCSYCVGCVNLRNKQYYIFNQPYTKEEYFKKLQELNLGSYKGISEVKKKLEELGLSLPKKYYEGVDNMNVTGDYIYNSKNVSLSYEVGGAENVKYSHFLIIAPTKDSYDLTMWGGGAERMYDSMGAGGGQSDVKFSFGCWTNAHTFEYCWYLLASGNNLFGCIGLKGKEYCILNKQYSKEEYETLLPRVIDHMNTMPYVDSLGRIYKYGEFFPPEVAPFSYNETIAKEYMPLSKEEAVKQGYAWKDADARSYSITLPNSEIPDNIADANDSILQEVIGCAHQGACEDQCSTAFKLIPAELEFYREMQLPLPRLCPNCRHYELLKQRNSLKLHKGSCKCAGATSVAGYSNTAPHFHGEGACPNEFLTSYAPDRPEIVYCEQCYNSEIA